MRRDWNILTLYQRFEAGVALVLTAVIAVIIVIALFRLGADVLNTLVFQTLDPLDHATFQRVFGNIMTLLIALEFNHTLQYVVARELGIVQARIVVLIALLALARKVIVMDLQAESPASIAALAALALGLGAAYWLINPRHRRVRPRQTLRA
jgi:uncharacterized membrane protein (DUF373 family)